MEEKTVVSSILEEVEQFDESLFLPTSELEPEEKVIGTATPFMRKLYSLAQYCSRESKQAGLEIEFGDKDKATAARHELMEDKHDILIRLFWFEVQESFEQWGVQRQIGVRRGWEIVLGGSDSSGGMVMGPLPRGVVKTLRRIMEG